MCDIHANDDYLTGYYFAKCFIKPILKLNSCASFHFGYANSQFLPSIKKCLGKQQLANRWAWYGADISSDSQSHSNSNHPSNILNGIDKSGDISNITTIKSIRNQLSLVLNDKLGFYICDIYPINITYLFNSIVIPLMDVDKNGFSILRLPDPHTWDVYSNTTIVNFILFVISHYHIVKIFKTPWGEKARYYLIISKPKSVFTQAHYTNFIRYLEELDRVCNNNSNSMIHLYSQIVFDNDEELDQWILSLMKIRNSLITYDQQLTTTEANTIWLENLFTKNKISYRWLQNKIMI